MQRFPDLYLIVLLSTLGFNMLSNSRGSTSFLEIIGTSMFQLGGENSTQSLGVFIMLMVSWIVGSILLSSKSTFHRSVNNPKNELKFWQSLAIVFGISLIGTFIYWGFHAGYMGTLAEATVNTIDGVINQVIQTEKLLTVYYVLLRGVNLWICIFLSN